MHTLLLLMLLFFIFLLLENSYNIHVSSFTSCQASSLVLEDHNVFYVYRPFLVVMKMWFV